MTASSKDIASFFENGTTDQFEYCFKLYPEALKLKAEKRSKKPQELIRLDEWYQNELPKLIKARGKDAHMVYDELVQTMKWKQSRGKFYPQLSYLVKVNTPRAVMQETKKAFRKLPNLEQAITALSNLKGVGTTMASALLAAAAPNSAPFMADECLMAIPEIEGIDYTTKEYLNFVHHIQSTVTRLNTEAGGETPVWSPHRVELALWAHYIANDLNPELLDEMPGPGSAANTNGSSAAGKIKPGNMLDGGGGDDTNDAVDADDESLGAAAGRGGEANNTATESETENENTNPPPTNLQMATVTGVSTAAAVAGILQDGDSNFVSNDSTSQEPIIDENTTQTTATTSTDDGEVGTPHGSDSDSYIAELPILGGLTGMSAVDIAAPLLLSGSSSNNAAAANTNNSNRSNTNNSKVATSITAAAASSTEAAATVVGNGNGTLLLGVSAATSADDDESIDGDINNCLQRTSANEVEASDDDEDDDEIDEDDSNNSNSRHGHKSVTPIINLNDGTTNTNTNTTDNDSTLSSVGIVGGLAQKRPLHCTVGGGGVADVEDANSQPEMKKIKSD